MFVDLPNRVANLRLPKSRPLLPLFEAITNSIDAIGDRKAKDGRIDVHIHRDKKQAAIDRTAPPTEAIVGFDIIDNGVGFTDENFTSFCTSDSSQKKNKGGKGIGRLSYLWAFGHADVESTYRSNGSMSTRRFRFELSKDGVTKPNVVKATSTKLQTTVKLVGANKDFKAECRRSTGYVGHRIIEHFLQVFALNTCPRIYVHDPCADGPDCLNDIFKRDVKLEERTKPMKVGDHFLQISHVRLSAKIADSHQIHFCARDRSVKAEDATRHVAHLQGRLDDLDGGSQFYYACYVSGPHLEKTLFSDRNAFDIPSKADVLKGEDITTWEDLCRAVARKAKTFLARYTAPTRKATMERIERYVERHPKYRPLLKHKPEWLDEVSFNIRDDELELVLHRLNQKYDEELKKRGQRVDRAVVGGKDIEAQKKKIKEFIGEWNEVGMAKLCDYVVHRKATLDFLDDCLKRQKNGDHALEDTIHDAIFPMRTTSDDKASEGANLWVIDERLSYHYHLASDKRFSKVRPVKVSKDAASKRGDLLIFQRFDVPRVIVDSKQPFDSITIIEFKRPGRDDYKGEKNPIDQVETYVNDLQSGKVEDKDGKLITPRPNTPYFAYIICTLTPRIKTLAKLRGFTETPDGAGYLKMHPTMGLYEEIMSYDKLLGDAQKRNQSFFDKLGIPGP